ncbi:rifin, partial [Plasmodium reichenowi]
ILLFALPLNILVYNQRNHKSITPHIPKIPTNRSLCECESYAPANYDNDSEMKEVMEIFSKQTQQRFHEYVERMKTTRQKCKDQCDKEIQKIILKDKLEKELMDKFATLQTDIQSDAIPTCICEKSLGDRVEKGCLRCGGVLGGGIAPSVGLLGGLGIYAWKPGALDAAIKAAIAKVADKILAVAKAAGDVAGKNAVIESLKELHVDSFWTEMSDTILRMSNYNQVTNFTNVIYPLKYDACKDASGALLDKCDAFDVGFGITDAHGTYTSLARNAGTNEAIAKTLNAIVAEADGAAAKASKAAEAAKRAMIETAQEKAIEATSTQLYSAIGYSVLAIIIIVLIMVIIYLILRYRRKKKMKKKLQYIKLLEE